MPEGITFGAESPAYVAIRALLFVGLLIAIGAIAFQGAVLEFLRRKQEPDSPMIATARHGAARAGLVGIVLVGLAAVLRLIAQSYAMHGSGDTFDATLVGSMLTSTVWGRGWLLQITAMIVAAFGFRAALLGRGGWWMAGLGVVALAFTPALSGHAASAPQLTRLAILADGLHVIGAGGWLGSLLLVLAVGLPAAMRLAEENRGPAVADLINAFSPTALVFAGISATTGVFAAWLHLGSVTALWQTVYGQTLLVKLAVLSLVAGTGAYNWLRVKPTLGNASSAMRIRRSARIELLVGAIVIVVTAVLVATPTAMDASASETMEGMDMPRTGTVAG
jgi:putative copper export protein